MRNRLKNIPEGFWESIKTAARFSLDNNLNRLGAAVYRNDNLFYQTSASDFCSALCSCIFAINRAFEPSGRLLHDQIKKLKKLPDEFLGRFESFIRPDSKMPPNRKYEIAQLLAKSIASM